MTRIYGRKPGDNDNTGNSKSGAVDFSSIDKPKDLKVNLKVNLDGNNNMGSDTIGTYHYVPYIAYQNSPGADHSYVRYYASYKYQEEYNKTEYYKRPNSTIHFTIKGGNMELTAYANNKVRKGDLYFPVPSDSDFKKYFPFFEGNTELQYSQDKSVSFTLYEDGCSNKNDGTFTNMTCRYIANDENCYEIELFYTVHDSLWNCNREFSAGKFKCSANGDEWTKISIGDFDSLAGASQIKGNGNAAITKDGKSYQAYIPLPSERSFIKSEDGCLGFNVPGFQNGSALKQERNNVKTLITRGHPLIQIYKVCM